MANPLQRILHNPLWLRIRRNHALEHATIHMLTARKAKTSLIGRADPGGFYLYGDVPTEEVREAVDEALQRLRAGEHHLAIHPNCGTNFLTAGLLAAGASFFSLASGRDDRWRDRLERLPLAIFATTLALILAQPLGAAAQQHITTMGDPGKLRVVGIRRMKRGRTVHRILTKG